MHSVDRLSKHPTRATVCDVCAVNVTYLHAEQTLRSFSAVFCNVVLFPYFRHRSDLTWTLVHSFVICSNSKHQKHIFRVVYSRGLQTTQPIRISLAVIALLSFQAADLSRRFVCHHMPSLAIVSCTDCIPSWGRKAWQIFSFVVISSTSLHSITTRYLLSFFCSLYQ